MLWAKPGLVVVTADAIVKDRLRGSWAPPLTWPFSLFCVNCTLPRGCQLSACPPPQAARRPLAAAQSQAAPDAAAA